MKWLKRLMLVVALLLALIVLVVGGGYALLRGTPDYYRIAPLTPEQRDAAAHSAEQTLIRMQNLAAEARRDANLALAGTTLPSGTPAGDTFTFTDIELNALFDKWNELYDWRGVYQEHLSDPAVVIRDGRLILAGRLKLRNLDSIVSLHFIPRLDPHGELHLDLVNVLGGKLPLPREMILGPMRERAQAELFERIDRWREQARIEPNGAANDDAVKASLGKLMLSALHDRPHEPVLFLPLAHGPGRVPVRITRIDLKGNTMTLTVVPLDVAQRGALLRDIREPAVAEASASTSPQGAR